MIRVFFSLIFLLFFSGCIQRIAIGSMGQIMENGFVVINEEQDLEIADKSIASSLKLLEAVLRSDPENERFLLLACQGYSSYALGFVEDENIPRAKVLYLRAKDFGMKILTRNEEFLLSMGKDEEAVNKALRSFGKDDLGAIFWTAIAWGSYISWSLDEPAALADLPHVEAMMKFVAERDPGFYFGGAHFFLGTIYGSQPKALGGDPALSRKHFEECIRVSGGTFLLPYVYFARTYAVQTQDSTLFGELLTRVDTTSLDVLPEARLSNAIAKRKAVKLRREASELFF